MASNYDALLELQSYELISLTRDAIIDEIRNLPSEEDLDKIPEIKFFLITASLFDLEMQNGGLCQFLVNEGKFHGPMLGRSLGGFGADRHGQLVARFCEENGIDLCDLEKLLPESGDPYRMTENYLRLCTAYPFGEFDKAYFALDRECPLEGILGAYIRENITMFF